MATFIEAARCKGSRPQGIIGHRFVSRPDIVGRLLHDRSVARFIVAPTGYGKSTVAFEYANLIFAFRHVFWIRCSSPCFLRDLDAGTLLSSLRRADPEAALVVCDDVPALDDARAAAFNAVADGILEQGCELIATCAPSADTFTHLQRDRMLLDGCDLLLTDDELTLGALGEGADGDALHALPAPQRAACLVWHDGGLRLLLSGAAHEEAPADMLLALLCLLMLGNGASDDLASFMSEGRASDAWDHLAGRYPYLGMDQRTGTYSAVPASMAHLADAFSSKLPELAAASIHGSRDAFATSMADVLLQRGFGRRAADLMARFASKGSAAAWLIRACPHLVRTGEAAAADALYDAVKARSGASADQLSLCECWACSALGSASEMLAYARRVGRSNAAAPAVKMTALALISLQGEGDEAARAARKLAQAAPGAPGAAADPQAAGAKVLSQVALAAAEGWAGALAAWDGLLPDNRDEQAGRDMLLYCATWLLDRAAPEGAGWKEAAIAPPDEREGAAARLVRLAVFCKGEAERDASAGAPDWFSSSAAAALEGACRSWAILEPFRPSGAASAAARMMAMRLATQREERAASIDAAGDAAPSLRGPGGHAASGASAIGVPMLSVNLFGGMEVRIGGRLVDPGYLRRMKVKTLLALLVMNRGRELSREALAAMLWPESPSSAYRNNFYSIWSQLKSSLTVEGSCPYLVRTQSGCSMDPRLVVSDVYEYEQLCRALLFGTEATDDWEGLYARVCTEYAGKLMPCEISNKTIIAMREHYHAQLVDGLIAAANRLVAAGEPQGAVWFAREAARREDKREDVYIALMEAQIAADQRSAAIETYFDCRRFLNEDLGIDPSMKLVELYRSIIEVEDVL